MRKKSLKNIPLIRFKGFSDQWEQSKLGDILKYEQPTEYIVKSTEYKDNFDVPVLTAGQSFILGYTNETEGVKNADSSNPIIIFDDFTTSIHYVDFPFKVKSSAMKLLTLKVETDNLNFIYNLMTNLKFVPQNHERHWISKFTKFKVSVPITEEQNRIDNCFKNLDKLILAHQRCLDILKIVKKVMLIKLLPNEEKVTPELRFKGYSNEWEYRKLSELTEYKNGKGHEDMQSSRGKFELVNLNSISIDGGLKHSGKFVDDTTETLIKNDLVMVLSDVGHGDLLGRVALIPKNDYYVLNQRVALLRPNRTVDPQFLFSYINAHQRYFKAQGAGMSQLNLSKGSVESFNSLIPSIEEQVEIGNCFEKIDNLLTLHQRKLENLKTIRVILLNHMFI